MYIPIVAIKRYSNSPGTMQEVITLCNDLKGLTTNDHVFIKPNLVGWDDRYPMPFFRIFTTSRLVEDMVIVLKDYGVSHITIGEGSVYFKGKERLFTTQQIFTMLGYPLLAQR